MSEQTPTNLSNADFTFKDKYGNTGKTKGVSTNDSTKLNNMVKLMNLMLNTPNSTDFINTLATKQYVDENQSSGLIPNQTIISELPLTDANLHLKDGALLSGSGAYSEYVDLIAEIYNGGSASSSFCTEAQWQTSNTNFGFCNKFVYDSVANTVRLPKVNSEHGALIKSYSSGSNWYRIYQDGFCEQGGIDTTWANDKDNTARTSTINLHIPYIDTNYSIFLGTTQPTAIGNGANNILYNSIAVSAFNIQHVDMGYVRTYWQTCGYTDISDLQIAPIYEYIVVGTVSKTDIQIDIDNVLTDLNGKADTNLINTVPTSAFANVLDNANIRTVVETYSNGTSWYRVYSDGWCEQGGHDTNTGASYQTKSITFLKEFIDTNYNFQKTLGGTTATFSQSTYALLGYVNGTKTTSSITVQYYGVGFDKSFDWIACGYIS